MRLPRWSPALLLGLIPVSAQAKPPTFTGNASADFDTSDFKTYVVTDQQDVNMQGAPSGTISGLDIVGLYMHYDPYTDVLYIGLQTAKTTGGANIIAGDVDGDGNPSSTASWLSAQGGKDWPDLREGENFSFYMDVTLDGIPDYIVGKPGGPGTTLADFKAAAFISGALYQPYNAFGTSLASNSAVLHANPSATKPHLEFTLANFSKLPALAGVNPAIQDVVVGIGAYMGSLDDLVVGEDAVPTLAQVRSQTFASPAGSIGGTVFRDWNGDGLKGADEDLMTGITVRLAGDWNLDKTSDSINVLTGTAGDYLFKPVAPTDYNGAALQSPYEIRVIAPFGYQPSTASGKQTTKVNERQVVTLSAFGLFPLDTDSDGIFDFEEGQDDVDGDGLPNYKDVDSDGDEILDEEEAGEDPLTPVDSDSDGADDYLDFDADNDGIEDDDETGEDSDGDGVGNYLDLDSDGDGIHDSTETQADKDGDGTGNFLDLDSDGDTFADSLEAGEQPEDPVDSDEDGKPDYVDQDSDNDGLLDRSEGGQDSDGDGLNDAWIDTDGDGVDNTFDLDSDADGIPDGVEAGTTYLNASSDTNTSSASFVPDGDPSHTSDPLDQDTDDDCIPDGTEDSDHDGARDPDPYPEDNVAPETWPDLADSDGDGLQDGTELGYTSGIADTASGACVPDADEGATTTDPNEADSDGGGKDDGEEDKNTNGVVDAGETNPNYGGDDDDSDGDGLPDVVEQTYGSDPFDTDSDDDGIPDGVEGITDVDRDGDANAVDTDSDQDGIPDEVEAADAQGDIDPADPYDSDGDGIDDYLDVDSDDDGLLDRLESASDHDGDSASDWRDPDADNDGIFDGTEAGVTLPSEGTSVSAGTFVADKDPTSVTSPQDADTDDDGLLDGTEDKNRDGRRTSDETLATNADTDGDCVQDGTELGLTAPEAPEGGANINDTDLGVFRPDTDPTTTTDPTSPDTDGGGTEDGGVGGEDYNCDGEIGPSETDPNDPTDDDEGDDDPDGDGVSTSEELSWGTDPEDADTDNDGIPDGEDGYGDADDDGVVDALEIDADDDGLQDGQEEGLTDDDVGEDTDLNVFEPDEDPSSTTDPHDADSDDDGLQDGEEDADQDGAWCEPGAEGCGQETDPNDSDTDSDGLQDGTEAGVSAAPEGTDPDAFEPDTDPNTTTDPLDDDSDDDGLLDGTEDFDHDGAQDPSDPASAPLNGETDPMNADSDGDCALDGTELGLDQPQGYGTDPSVFVPDPSPFSTTDPLNPDTDGDGEPDGVRGPDGECDFGAGGGPITGEVLGGGGWRGGCDTTGGSAGGLALWGALALLVRLRRARAAALLTLLLVPSAARAADGEVPFIDTQHFSPAHDLAGGAVTEGTRTLPASRFAGGAWLNFADDPLILYVDEDTTYELQQAVLGMDLLFSAGLTEGLQVSGRLPVTLYQWYDEEDPFELGPTHSAIHDAEGAFRWRIADLDDTGTGVALAGKVWLATGMEQSYAGGQFSAAGYLMVDHWIGPRWVGANLGYRWRPYSSSLGSLTVDDEVTWRVGAHTPAGDFRVGLDLWGSAGTTTRGDGTVGDSPLEALLSVSRAYPDGPRLMVGLGTGLVAGYGVPDWRLAAGVAWGEPAAPDLDRDGIPNKEDGCPEQPEDFDGYQDEDGCPDPDNDQDGILDAQDRCPMEPEDVDGYQDEDGCPDPDNDQDGLLDFRDRCPNDPEDKDGFQDEDGCPDPDNDKDGLLDAQDRCPEIPEDIDGFEDGDGCPDPDNDGDGLLDAQDKCPTTPENFNGIDDTDGCPDMKVDTSKIKVDRDQLILLEQIYFEFNKDVIRPASYGILDAAAQVFRDNPTLKVRIEGHTDNVGGDDYNLKLSQRRADAVKRYLVEQGGLDPSRFETVGYGETRPKAENDNETGRALNRRIEWWIISR